MQHYVRSSNKKAISFISLWEKEKYTGMHETPSFSIPAAYTSKCLVNIEHSVFPISRDNLPLPQ